MESLGVGGSRIAFERRGAGSPLVLLHGGASDHREWRHQLDGLSDAFDVIAWDAPGCGASSDPPATFRMPNYALVLAAFLDRLGLERPHVAGLSWGSALALELWRQRPDLPRSLVLAAPYAGWAGSLAPDGLKRRVAGTFDDLERPPDEWIPAFLETLFTPDADDAARDLLVEIMQGTRPAGAHPMVLAMAEADLRPVLTTISVPTLLLRGDADVRSTAPSVNELADAIPRSTIATIARCGHQANVERPDRFNEAVRRFLAGVA